MAKQTELFTQSAAFKRGVRDAEINRLEVDAGLRGPYIKNSYPSNPYHQSDFSHLQYNAGWNSVGIWHKTKREIWSGIEFDMAIEV